jgi:hypothetical protein
MPFIAGIVLYKVRARSARMRGCGGLLDLKPYCVARHRMIVNQKRLLAKPNLNVTSGCAGPQDWTVAQQSHATCPTCAQTPRRDIRDIAAVRQHRAAATRPPR